jgi:uncharacterized repeat protein (TIGR02543 family)
VVNVVASPAEGYEFVEWTRDGANVSDEESFAFTMPAEDVLLTAHFSEIVIDPMFNLTLTATPAEGGTAALAGGQDEGPFSEGTMVNVVAAPAEGYEFVEWTSDGVKVSDEESFAFTIPNKDTELLAIFILITSTDKVFDNTVVIYPNPFTDNIYLKNNHNIERVTITSIEGQRVWDGKGSRLHVINPGNLSSGIYLIYITFKNGEKQVVRMVKK